MTILSEATTRPADGAPSSGEHATLLATNVSA